MKLTLKALHWAVKGGNLKAAQYLLSRGADPELKTKEGKLCVDFATYPEMKQLFPNSQPQAEGGTPTPVLLSGTLPLPLTPISSIKSPSISSSPEYITYKPAAYTTQPQTQPEPQPTLYSIRSQTLQPQPQTQAQPIPQAGPELLDSSRTHQSHFLFLTNSN